MPRLFVMGRVTVRLTLEERAQLARAADAAGVSFAVQCAALLGAAERAANEAARRMIGGAVGMDGRPPAVAAEFRNQLEERPAPVIPPDPHTMLKVVVR